MVCTVYLQILKFIQLFTESSKDVQQLSGMKVLLGDPHPMGLPIIKHSNPSVQVNKL